MKKKGLKFYREVTNENGRAFSWFLGIFSLVLMALALLTGMPWYLCFLFIAFSALCATSVIDLSPCRLLEGRIEYFRLCRRRTVRVADANILLVTEYCGPMRRSGPKPYEVKVAPGSREKRKRAYAVLLNSEDIDSLGKCTNNHMAKLYYRKQGALLFSMAFGEEVFAGILKEGFSGKVYVFSEFYGIYRKEIDAAVKASGFDYSQVLVIG